MLQRVRTDGFFHGRVPLFFRNTVEHVTNLFDSEVVELFRDGFQFLRILRHCCVNAVQLIDPGIIRAHDDKARIVAAALQDQRISYDVKDIAVHGGQDLHDPFILFRHSHSGSGNLNTAFRVGRNDLRQCRFLRQFLINSRIHGHTECGPVETDITHGHQLVHFLRGADILEPGTLPFIIFHDLVQVIPDIEPAAGEMDQTVMIQRIKAAGTERARVFIIIISVQDTVSENLLFYSQCLHAGAGGPGGKIGDGVKHIPDRIFDHILRGRIGCRTGCGRLVALGIRVSCLFCFRGRNSFLPVFGRFFLFRGGIGARAQRHADGSSS